MAQSPLTLLELEPSKSANNVTSHKSLTILLRFNLSRTARSLRECLAEAEQSTTILIRVLSLKEQGLNLTRFKLKLKTRAMIRRHCLIR